jgi:serine/threonine-protein kinase
MRNDIQRALSGAPLAAQMRGGAYAQSTRRMGPDTQLARTGAVPPYDYGRDGAHGGPPKRRAWPWVVGAVVVALAVLLVLGLMYINGSTSDVTVPSVRGLSVTKAEAALRADHLTVSQVVPTASTSIAKNQVIGTSPPAGSSEPKGTAVRLLVSSGAGNTTVPNVVHQSLQTAETLLRQAGLKWTTQMVASAAPLNTVVRQSPAANSSATRGQSVTLFVSEHNLLRVPNVIGLPLGQAQSQLSQSPYNYVVTVKYSTTNTGGYAPGYVFATSPMPHHALAPGSSITVYVVQQPQSSSPSPSSSSPSPSTSSPTPPGP